MIANILKSGLDLVLPPLCLSCRTMVAEPGTLCPDCWQAISFLAPPFCDACGHPFEHDLGPGAICGACMDEPYPFKRARAVFRYDDASRSLILRFKHADRLEGAKSFAKWMARAGVDVLEPGALLVPVPLHRWRLFSRRYNQAALLALALGRETGLAVDNQALVRHRWTPVQGRLGRAERAKNVRGAFSVSTNRLANLSGRHIILVDDVMTTGITLAECAQALLKSGAKQVDVLTLGRVVR
jgi:ComF family protein